MTSNIDTMTSGEAFAYGERLYQEIIETINRNRNMISERCKTDIEFRTKYRKDFTPEERKDVPYYPDWGIQCLLRGELFN